MPSTFARTKDRFKTNLAQAHAIGDGVLVLTAGAAASLGAPGANRIWRVTAVTSPDTAQEIVLAQFDATGVSGNNLTGVTPTTGYSDVNVPLGTPIRIRWTKAHVTEIQDALTVVEATVAAGQIPLVESTDALPAATADLRGQKRLKKGANGERDRVVVCIKLDDDTYGWEALLL